MPDTFTKIILAVIAVALVALVLQNTVGNARAVGPGCGTSPTSPCYIAIEGKPIVQIMGSVDTATRIRGEPNVKVRGDVRTRAR